MTRGSEWGILLAVKNKPSVDLGTDGHVFFVPDHVGSTCEDPACEKPGLRTCRYKLTGDKTGQYCDRRYCYSTDDSHGDGKHCGPHMRLVAKQ